MMKELLEQTRSYRRFYNERALTEQDILALAEAVRLSPSAANRQRIRIAAVTDRAECDAVFSTLSFAAYLKDWQGPAECERPAAYVVVMSESELDTNLALDAGLCMEAMLLTARERGIGGCIFRSFKQSTLSAILGRDGYTPIAVIALGYPSETVEITSVKDGDIRYYRDENDVHMVPKYSAEEYVI